MEGVNGILLLLRHLHLAQAAAGEGKAVVVVQVKAEVVGPREVVAERVKAMAGKAVAVAVVVDAS